MKKELTSEKLRELLHYDPETGVFVWLRRTSNRVKVGDVAGRPHVAGYWQIGIDGTIYLAHRLAWMYVNGEMPTGVIDHIDRDKRNNRWENLRCVTQRENLLNAGMRRDSTSGHKGVHFAKREGKWLAHATERGRLKHLGYFDTKEQAARRRIEYINALNEPHVGPQE